MFDMMLCCGALVHDSHAQWQVPVGCYGWQLTSCNVTMRHLAIVSAAQTPVQEQNALSGTFRWCCIVPLYVQCMKAMCTAANTCEDARLIDMTESTMNSTLMALLLPGVQAWHLPDMQTSPIA